MKKSSKVLVLAVIIFVLQVLGGYLVSFKADDIPYFIDLLNILILPVWISYAIPVLLGFTSKVFLYILLFIICTGISFCIISASPTKTKKPKKS